MFKVCILSVLIILTGCNGKKSGVIQPETATSGEFELIADETLKPAVDSLISDFNRQTPNAKVTVRYKNATEALDDLLQNHARLVLIARPLAKKERDIISGQKIELIESDVAENAIACIVNSRNSLQTISMDSLRAIVLGNDKNVTRILSSYLSATEFVVDSVFSLLKYQEGRVIRFQTTDSIITRMRKEEHSIGFISSAWLKKLTNMGDTSLRALKISSDSGRAIMLHLAYILQGFYPLVSRVCAYTTEVPNTLPRGFLAYVMSADGQRIFLNYDLLPKTQILKLVPPK